MTKRVIPLSSLTENYGCEINRLFMIFTHNTLSGMELRLLADLSEVMADLIGAKFGYYSRSVRSNQ